MKDLSQECFGRLEKQIDLKKRVSHQIDKLEILTLKSP